MQILICLDQGFGVEEDVGGVKNGCGRLVGKVFGGNDLKVNWSGWVSVKRLFQECQVVYRDFFLVYCGLDNWVIIGQ